MTEKELKKLGRGDLIEMLLMQKKENEQLQLEFEKVKEQLVSRKLVLDNAGSIAEASLQLTGIFQAAQESCSLYMENIEQLSIRQEEICAKMQQDCEALCQQKERETTEKCEKLDRETTARCEQLDWETKARCEKLDRDTIARCEQMENETTARCAKKENDTAARCMQLEGETEVKCNKMMAEAKQKSQEYWNQVSSRVKEFYESYTGLKELLDLPVEKNPMQE